MLVRSSSLPNLHQTAQLTLRQVEAAVRLAIPSDLIDILIYRVEVHPKSAHFWRLIQPPNFKKTMVILTIYKDLQNLGDQKMIDLIALGFLIKQKSLTHNIKICRRIFYEWSFELIQNEGPSAWNRKAINLPKKKGLEKINLFLDSSDFRLVGKRSTSKKSVDWSYKSNGPGQRFQVLFDANTVVQGVWGGYSPKVYDGDWVRIAAQHLIENFNEGHIIADCHYETANASIQRVNPSSNLKFYTPIPQPRGRKRKRAQEEGEDITQGLAVLTKKQEAWNKDISHVRARTELPFGLIKKKWKSLDSVFFGDHDQHEYLVRFAIAVHNYSILFK